MFSTQKLRGACWRSAAKLHEQHRWQKSNAATTQFNSVMMLSHAKANTKTIGQMPLHRYQTNFLLAPSIRLDRLVSVRSATNASDKSNKETSPSSPSRNTLQQMIETRAKSEHTSSFWYIMSGFVVMLGASYAAVPLFKLFCESQGIDANMEFRDSANVEQLQAKLSSMRKDESRRIQVKFVASTSSDLLWKFEPAQEAITLAPGETALAFFKAKNLTDKSIVGIATYTILPYDAGLYFNKIQCFCFEEQRLDPHEEVDMPVFFYIDEQYSADPKLEEIDQICLSYTFFESKGSEELSKLQQLMPYQNTVHKLANEAAPPASAS